MITVPPITSDKESHISYVVAVAYSHQLSMPVIFVAVCRVSVVNKGMCFK